VTDTDSRTATDDSATSADSATSSDNAATDGGAPTAERAPTAGPLATLRGQSGRRRLVTLAAVVVGVGVAWLHWLGLVAGAALVALPQRSFRLGLAAGVGFGAVAVVVNVAFLAASGPAALATAFAMMQVFGVSVAAPLVAGVVGGLVRGVV